MIFQIEFSKEPAISAGQSELNDEFGGYECGSQQEQEALTQDG